jgi:4-hydroxyacetophenone monooxygenase
MQARFAEAVTIANVPTLLMVLVQLTGDERWLEAPYRVARARGMSDNDSGGLSEPLQQGVRDAALDAVLAWRGGKPAAITEPSPELLVKMLSRAMGEAVPPEYGDFTAAQLAMNPTVAEPITVPDGFNVMVVGAGASGLCAAVHLKQAGIPFKIIEKHDRVGGVWYENSYPGAGVDTPNHLYSFSFLPYDWPMYFALRDDLYAYMEHVAQTYALYEHIHLSSEVESAQWDETHSCWKVTVRYADGTEQTETATVLMSATGIFNPPSWPDIDGVDSFDGICFHSAQWPADVELTNQRVAVIGNGASAMQIGPEIQNDVASLAIFQRSNHWAAPFDQFRKEVPGPLRFLLREVPFYRAWYPTMPIAATSHATSKPSSAIAPTCSTRCSPPTRPTVSAC